MSTQQEIPIQPVESPVICSPYDEPKDHWFYDKETGVATRAGDRREAGYWYKTDRVGTGQTKLFLEEDHDLLTLVNLLRKDVRRWRDADYRGASSVTKDLLRHWGRPERERRLFFCQREAVETIIYLAELRIPGKTSRTKFQNFSLSDDDLKLLLRGAKPSFHLTGGAYFPTLVDLAAESSFNPLRRLGCKMATGSGKTVVMAMLISWAFCNRAQNPQSKEFPNGVFVCCPNLTVKERLQVLRPENPKNYYSEFDIVPEKYRRFMHAGKVLVENWHRLNPESEHKEGDATYAVVNKGPETPETLARRVLGDLYERMPLLVLNDEGHHCWRPPLTTDVEGLSGEEKKALEEEADEAKVWMQGLDALNNAIGSSERGISFCVDLSATPFYLKGSGHPEGRPFPWLVSDFGLVDAIESGIVKIPRLPVSDTTGRPDPKYFKLWEWIKDGLQPAELMSGKSKKPRPNVVYREAQGALIQIADQWLERFKYNEEALPGQKRVPPVLIIVCDNTDVAEIFYQHISGERQEEVATEADVEAVFAESEIAKKKKPTSKQKKKTVTVYEGSKILPEFSNTPTEKRTIRIDSKLLAEAESDDPNKKKTDVAEELRRVVATVGKEGEPGEHVRCVVSVSMLTEGWDANNVTHILGVRAFGSQLLCEQVVGRGLRRVNYKPDKETGLLPEEYVDVYGIPFSLIPFKGRPAKKPEPDDKPLNSVRALENRIAMEIKFPMVEGYTFALRKNLIRCDIDRMEALLIEPNREPTATYLAPQVGIKTGSQSQFATEFFGVEQNRENYYEQNHLQTIEFEIARYVLEQLIGVNGGVSDQKRRVLRLQSRHQLFPQVYRFVQEYVERKVNFQGSHPCELGLLKYVERIVERLRDGIEPDQSEGEPPLLPVLFKYEPVSSTANVQFLTKRAVFATQRSHINYVVADTQTWESSAAFRLEQSRAVTFYARNDHMDFRIPYEYQGIDHNYEPDYLVRLKNDTTLILEIKGYEDDQDKAKHNAAKRWVSAVNNWKQLGRWDFHVCRNPQLLDKELKYLIEKAA
jgi:type III restriction enzyme